MTFEIYRTSNVLARQEDGAPFPTAVWDGNKKIWTIEIGTLEELMDIIAKCNDNEWGNRVVITLPPTIPCSSLPIIEIYDTYRE